MSTPRIGFPPPLRLAGAFAHVRQWLGASTWAPHVLPAALRRPLLSYAFALGLIGVADCLTALLEHTFAGFAFHGMLGLLALLCVAAAWGGAPGAVAAAGNAILLTYVIVPPHMGPGPLPRLASLVLGLAIGVAAAMLAGSAEARRRGSVQLSAEHKGLVDDAQQARAEAETALRHLRALQSMTDAAFASLSAPDLMRIVLARVAKELSADSVVLLLVTPDQQHLVVHMAHGVEASLADGTLIPVGEGFAGRIASSRKPLTGDDVRGTEPVNLSPGLALASLAGVPVLLGDQLLGVLQARAVAGTRFDDVDVSVLQHVAERVAWTLEHTRHHEREQAMRAEAEADRSRLQQVIEALPEAIVLYDAGARRVSVNRSAAAILGDNALGRQAGDSAQAPRHLDGSFYVYDDLPFVRSLRHGDVVTGEQLLLRNLTTGVEYPILLNSAPLRAGDGSIHGAVSVFQDISSIKDFERGRERLWATLSHDLKNPLTSIYGMGQLLHNDVQLLEEPQRTKSTRIVATILSATERMLTEINTLVERSRVPAVRLSPPDTRQSVNLVAFLRQLAAEYQQGTNKHVIQVCASDEVFLVPIESESLHRVVANVLANAIKYSPEGGNITIDVDRPGTPSAGRVRLRVTDQGIGIPAADLSHVFDQFYRASNVDGVIAGTGIGLAGVRQTVERCGGTVSIESELGKGTTVSIQLPLLPFGSEKEVATTKLDPAAHASEDALHV